MILVNEAVISSLAQAHRKLYRPHGIYAHLRPRSAGWLNDGDEHGRVIICISAQSAAMPGGGRGRRIYEGYILIARINSRGYRGRALPITSRATESSAERERESIRKRTGPRRAAPRRAIPPAHTIRSFICSARVGLLKINDSESDVNTIARTGEPAARVQGESRRAIPEPETTTTEKCILRNKYHLHFLDIGYSHP